MSRDIALFQGKRVDNGEWVEGFYFEDNGCFIKELCSSGSTGTHLVYPETVRHYIGKRDKNQKKIFQGDIVKESFYGFPVPFHNFVFLIEWQDAAAGYGANYFGEVEVIGNKFDNPELLKESN